MQTVLESLQLKASLMLKGLLLEYGLVQCNLEIVAGFRYRGDGRLEARNLELPPNEFGVRPDIGYAGH